MTSDPVALLNSECFCVGVDPVALRRELESDAATRGLYDSLQATHAYLFARSPIFVSRRDVTAMESLVAAVETVVALPAYRDTVLGWAPDIARSDPGPRGVLMGYDFHLTDDGPRLIEINTNAGGALLNAALSRAQRACCAEVLEVLREPRGAQPLQDALFEMFESEWRLQRGATPLRRVAIVDERPEQQYLYPEFLLAAELFRSRGVEAVICDPSELELAGSELRQGGEIVDLVYNRLTDFAFEDPRNATLREAYTQVAVVVTPHPRAHALYADKRNLSVLGDGQRLTAWGLPSSTVTCLERAIPRTETVTVERADELWTARRQLFFKPVSGYGSRATYRGDKLTRRVWAEILAGRYVAQALVPPSERSVLDGTDRVRLKLDVRCYVYAGRLLLLAGRLYRGQTTNFRTPGGGFATVLCPAA
jgi:hypothetical protein